jgi:probable F420-dependent oxidoreductase
MKIGVFATFMSPQATPGMIRDFGRRAEGIGLESIWMGEHVALFDKNTFGYPGAKDGRIPVPEGGGLLDVVATFGFLAAATSRLRLGTGVALVPQRNPIYTAKEICTLDWLTDGRIDFGIGVGWNKEEVEACGYRWEDRGARCDEFLEIMRRLWTEPVVDYAGKWVKFETMRLDPKPIQKPHVPIIVGGYADAALRRAVRFGAGWYGFNRDPAGTGEMIARLDAAFAKAGRTRGDEFQIIITPPMAMSIDAMQAYAELGVHRLLVNLGSQQPERSPTGSPNLKLWSRWSRKRRCCSLRIGGAIAHAKYLLEEKIIGDVEQRAVVLVQRREHEVAAGHAATQLFGQDLHGLAKVEGAPDRHEQARGDVTDHRPHRQEPDANRGDDADQHRPQPADADAPGVQDQESSADPQQPGEGAGDRLHGRLRHVHARLQPDRQAPHRPVDQGDHNRGSERDRDSADRRGRRYAEIVEPIGEAMHCRVLLHQCGERSSAFPERASGQSHTRAGSVRPGRGGGAGGRHDHAIRVRGRLHAFSLLASALRR